MGGLPVEDAARLALSALPDSTRTMVSRVSFDCTLRRCPLPSMNVADALLRIGSFSGSAARGLEGANRTNRARRAAVEWSDLPIRGSLDNFAACRNREDPRCPSGKTAKEGEKPYR